MPDVDVRPGAEGWSDLVHALDLHGGLIAAEATLRGALERRETRGAHNRSDHPDIDPALEVNFYARLDDEGRMEIRSRPVPDAPAELGDLVERAPKIDAGADRLLE